MNAVLIRGPKALFPQLASIVGLSADHGVGGEVGDDRVLSAHATDDAIAAARALGFTVEVEATVLEQGQMLAQVLQEGGDDVTEIDIA